MINHDQSELIRDSESLNIWTDQINQLILNTGLPHMYM